MSSPKVVLNPTPTEKLTNREKAELEDHVIDADGKVYKLRVPDPLDEFDLSAALGKESMNFGLFARAMPLIFIESINGEAFMRPGSYAEIRAGLKRLGTNGMKVVMAAMQRYQEAQSANEQENLDAIKK